MVWYNVVNQTGEMERFTYPSEKLPIDNIQKGNELVLSPLLWANHRYDIFFKEKKKTFSLFLLFF